MKQKRYEVKSKQSLQLTTINIIIIHCTAHTLCLWNNTCSLELYGGDLQTTTVFIMQHISHKTDWLTTTSCLLTLSAKPRICIVLYKQSDERSWSRMFVISLSQKLYRVYIAVCVFCSHCLLLRSLVYTLPSHTVCWFTCVTSSL